MTAYDARPRILIIENDPAVASFEVSVLVRAGYRAETAHTGRTGLALLQSYKPHVVVLDIGLPDMSGLDVCATIADTADAYVLMVSQSHEDVELASVGFYADDVISKPISPSELVARVDSFVRRRECTRSDETESRLAVGDAALVREYGTLEKDGRSVSLTALEFRLLWFLGAAAGKLLTRAQILERVWDDVSGVPTRVVDVHVAALRRKARELGAHIEISSVRGIGYRLDTA